MNFRTALYIFIIYFSTPSGVFTSNLNPRKVKEVKCTRSDVGEQLILTPLLEQGKIEEAKTAATVKLSGKAEKIKSYAGYFTVNKTYNSNSYFWFFPSNDNYTRDPVLLWLQGGPGVSSLYGLLEENGPILVDKDLQLDIREYSWTNNHSMIYIDNPVGVGFSFTDDDNGYARNETQIGTELYNALQQFFELFPELRQNDFFITGSSYAGKYISALGYTIHRNNLSAQKKINLKGVSIGNGYISPELQTGFAEYVYQLGLLDKNASDVVRKYEDEAVEYISKGDYLRSADMRGMALDIIVNISKVSPYNYLEEATDSSDDLTLKFLNRSEIRRAIHVGNTTFGSDKAIDYLNEDIQQSVVPWFIEVANNYRVLLYTGQLDIILAYPLTLNFLKNVEFNDIQEYRKAERKTWYVGDDVAGYSKSGGKFTEVLVRKAGHIVTVDQPKWAEDLTNRFTRNKPIY